MAGKNRCSAQRMGGNTLSPSIVNQAAVDVGTLAQRMANQYFTHVTAMYVARDPRAALFAPEIEPGQIVPIIRIPRRNGTDMQLHFHHYLAENRKTEALTDFDKVWLMGALLQVGDALGAHGHFNHAPEAEMIRHLRNGIAHGNRFNFHDGVKDKSTGKLKHPAHISRYADRQVMPHHQIDTHLQGQEVLWNWGGPEAVWDCLTVLGIHLWNMGHGIPVP